MAAFSSGLSSLCFSNSDGQFGSPSLLSLASRSGSRLHAGVQAISGYCHWAFSRLGILEELAARADYGIPDRRFSICPGHGSITRITDNLLALRWDNSVGSAYKAITFLSALSGVLFSPGTRLFHLSSVGHPHCWGIAHIAASRFGSHRWTSAPSLGAGKHSVLSHSFSILRS